MLVRTLLAATVSVLCTTALAAPKPARKAPAAPPVPAEAPTMGMGVMVASLICQYCLEASAVTIRRTTGKAVPLSKLDFMTEADNQTNGPQTAAVVTAKGATALHSLNLSSLTLLGWNADYKPTLQLVEGLTKPDRWLPGIVRVDPHASWRSLLRTSHVCLGSTFQVPTFYLVGNDDKSMGRLPTASHGPRATDYADLPKTPTQTFCEGRLVDVEEVLKSFAARQTAAAIQEFEDKTSDTALKEWVTTATEAHLRQNRAELETIAARVLGHPPKAK